MQMAMVSSAVKTQAGPKEALLHLVLNGRFGKVRLRLIPPYRV